MRSVWCPVAESNIACFEDQRVLVSERFDRRLARDGRWWLRLPQEDCCQALGNTTRSQVSG